MAAVLGSVVDKNGTKNQPKTDPAQGSLWESLSKGRRGGEEEEEWRRRGGGEEEERRRRGRG